ncbi:hypothetical protein AVEN_266182-1 [Araneus ventricosus]|uniref:Uncharacterized protein n=1 Tax=Araneus ventricosus TaxID=182803 RepID=A0A4Y2D481_ARAVE|nr:hypothetical protein AVEN_266182-1 [Araneus ventricosus]
MAQSVGEFLQIICRVAVSPGRCADQLLRLGSQALGGGDFYGFWNTAENSISTTQRFGTQAPTGVRRFPKGEWEVWMGKQVTARSSVRVRQTGSRPRCTRERSNDDPLKFSQDLYLSTN